MESMPEFNSERREFFRITDSVFIDYSILSAEEAERLIPTIKNPIKHNSNSNSDNRHRFNALQTNINHLIDQISQSDREIARALRLIDEKTTLLASAIHQQENSAKNKPVVNANISGGGIAFLVKEHHPVKSAIQITIEFQSSGCQIDAIGHVVACNKAQDAPKETPYLLRIVFSHMSEPDCNLLVKHTLSRQALDLRLSKESMT